ncbi:hypothetical protein B0H34DRAFT_17426 [Crassisporium funariophilum]|nr:hypothetical protein B0H34DRAFT_17426 [Crassisporium funariophilum]
MSIHTIDGIETEKSLHAFTTFPLLRASFSELLLKLLMDVQSPGILTRFRALEYRQQHIVRIPITLHPIFVVHAAVDETHALVKHMRCLVAVAAITRVQSGATTLPEHHRRTLEPFQLETLHVLRILSLFNSCRHLSKVTKPVIDDDITPQTYPISVTSVRRGLNGCLKTNYHDSLVDSSCSAPRCPTLLVSGQRELFDLTIL